MTDVIVPYSIPPVVDPELQIVRAYWESLKRAGNEMPFWDDVKISALPELSDQLMLIDVFEGPIRFRFNHVGKEIERRFGEHLHSAFADEIRVRPPFEYLLSQCSATVEGARPTFYRHAVGNGRRDVKASYSRLLLPMWGDGHIGMLLGSYAWH